MVFDAFRRGLRMDLESLRVLARFPRLMVLPLVAGLLTIAMWAAVFVPILFSIGPDLFENPLPLLLVFAVLYVLTAFIAFLFEAALIDAAADHFRGEPVSIAASLKQVWGRKGAIFGWAVIAATVGLVLGALGRKAGLLGRIVVSAIGLVWSLATLLVLPTIIYEDVGPWEGLKRSVARFKRHWGEVGVGSLGIGLLFGLMFVGVFFLVIPLMMSTILLGPAAAILTLLVFGALVVLIILAAAAAKGVFVAAVYTYVQTGAVPSAYTPALVQQPFS